MIIPIDDKYRLKSDSMQWMIQKSKIVKGEIEWRPLKFFHDPSKAVTELILMQIRESDAETLVHALEEVERITSHVLSALNPRWEVRRIE